MSLSSTGMVMRALDRLAADHALRGPGDPCDDLLARARRLRAEARHLRLPALAAEAALREGEILLRVGPAGMAVPMLETAARELDGTLATGLLAAAIARTAEAYLEIGALDRVLDLCAAGIALVQRDRHKTTAPYLQAAYLRRVISLYANGVRAAHELGDPRMLTWMELSKSHALPRPGRAPDDAALEGQLADLSRQIDEHRARHGGADPLPLRQRRRTLFDRLVTLGARAGPAAPSFHLDRVRRALAPDQRAVSYYWVDPTRLLIVVVAPDGATSHLQPVDPDQRRAVDELAAAVYSDRVTARDLPPLLDRIAPAVLPDPVRAALAGARRLLVAPHRALHAVPFAALPFEGRRLLHAMAVATIPNLTCLLLPTEVPPLRVLSVGVTDYTRAAPHAGGPVPPPRCRAPNRRRRRSPRRTRKRACRRGRCWAPRPGRTRCAA
ncbi:hypothetical protein Prum_089260 [Phytohabitans rumicis]|uniref:CHAT domain-containing protein n=1 Tax=Phytohabitans rumicis TaxID=1076125 RepID=A0A6V8LG45_9ACTN|nr:hypothetical protein Prum_089260 [Phytohabitans rumicis]